MPSFISLQTLLGKQKMTIQLIKTLKQYPDMIFDQELKLLDLLQDKNQCKSDLDLFMLGIDNEIAANKELKNESQRKAAKRELLVDNQVYSELVERLENSDRTFRIAQSNLDKIKNDFSVAKIEVRFLISQSIVSKELELV